MSNTRKLPKDKEAVQPTSAKAWKKNGATLQLPSGNAMRLKNPGIMELASKGLVPNALMAVIMDAIKKGKEPKPEEIMSENIEINDMFEMMDKAIIEMAQEPEVFPLPEQGEKRDPDAVYIDDIDQEDKMFIWGWATGGTDDVEQFRKERAGLLATLPGQQAVGGTAKRAPARKR